MHTQREKRRLRASNRALRNEHREAGFSLIEIMITVSLMAIIIVPLMMAASTTIKASASSRNLSKVDTVLNNAADRVNRAPELCDYSDYIEAPALSVQWTADRVSATYQYYTPGASASVTGTWTTGACPGCPPAVPCPTGTHPDGLVQRVTITVSSPNNVVQRTMEVVKSDV
jgi:prepilin-type N-terminal cleavage/methylation domain-containing protein